MEILASVRTLGSIVGYSSCYNLPEAVTDTSIDVPGIKLNNEVGLGGRVTGNSLGFDRANLQHSIRGKSTTDLQRSHCTGLHSLRRAALA